MRKLILATVAAVIVGAPLASAVKAEDTTVTRKDEPDRDTTVIKKKEDVNVLPVPHREEKTIIKKDSD
jgi:5,10-methylene-tetrahydrofolate dehydrogenase/methenyl tetrahydrofolate cyclohydrolase